MPWTPDLQNLEDRFRQRLLVVYIFVVASLVVTIATLQWLNVTREQSQIEFQHRLTGVCYVTRDNTLNLNSAVDQLIASVQTSKVLTPSEKAERVAFYRQIYGKVPECPPR